MVILMKTIEFQCISFHNVSRLTVSSQHEPDEHCHQCNDNKRDQWKSWDKKVKQTSKELRKGLLLFLKLNEEGFVLFFKSSLTCSVSSLLRLMVCVLNQQKSQKGV